MDRFVGGARGVRARGAGRRAHPRPHYRWQNNHDWKSTTPALKKILEDGGLFRGDVLTTPPKDGDFSAFKPEFSRYRVVISNYNDFPNGSKWPADVQAAFEKYVREGGGFVSYHAADNAFPEWTAFNLTAFSDPANKGTGHDEPMLMTIGFGKGRVFHTTLGHDVPAMECVGFMVTLRRGAEWAATGKVTVKVPPDFPTADKASTRPLR